MSGNSPSRDIEDIEFNTFERGIKECDKKMSIAVQQFAKECALLIFE